MVGTDNLAVAFPHIGGRTYLAAVNKFPYLTVGWHAPAATPFSSYHIIFRRQPCQCVYNRPEYTFVTKYYRLSERVGQAHEALAYGLCYDHNRSIGVGVVSQLMVNHFYSSSTLGTPPYVSL